MATDLSNEERLAPNRIAPRYEFDSRIRICLERDGVDLTFRGWVRDISESGLRAFVAQDLRMGELATIYLPLGEGDKVSLLARVVRKAGTEHGFQFTSLSVEQRVRIRVALQQENTIPQ
jgi:PilZ domain